ncbi:N-6 DNA methylase, partial [mine drainage metagenome]
VLRSEDQQALHPQAKTLARSDLDEFVELYKPENRADRKPTFNPEDGTGRWRAFDLKDILARDKANLDIFWLKDDSLEDTADLPDPEVIAQEVVEDLEDAAEQLRGISARTARRR